MLTLSLLDEMVTYLQQHEQSLRIKKLILCAARRQWESDPNVLDSLNLGALIEELYHNNPTIHDLKNTLTRIVRSLNKPSEYAVIANIIFGQIKELYRQQIDHTTEISVNHSVQNNSTEMLSTSMQTVANFNQELPVNNGYPSRKEYNSYDVREEIIKYTNPLRAKIVLFSTLYYKFRFDNQDWNKLRNILLDDLLNDLLRKFTNFKELDMKLTIAASCLEPQNEYTQSAGAILQCLKCYY
jgi:hypothetical protein